ncbi:hypothetical protein COCOBI_04-1610 [Coccomyxa sp. Obi]|nr:hypothetical protein COCOBI_04-1610 [Coccomyxa sp. Obi]
MEAAKEKTYETASTLKETAERAKERAEEATEATKEKLSETASTAKEKAEQAKEAAKEKLSDTASTAKNTAERAKGAASETASEAVNRIKSTADGTAKVTAETIGQASTPQGASGVYGALTAMHGALGSAHLLSPTLASDFIFASAEPFDLLQYPLHRLLGTGHLAAAWSMWILKGAAEKRRLHLPEFQRLNLGLTTFAAATLGVNMLHWELLRPSAALTAAAIAGITAAAPTFYYSRTSGHGLRAGPILQGLTHDLGNLMQIWGMKSAVYSALTVAILGAGSAYMAMPYESLMNVFTYTEGPDCIMLWRSIGAALLLLPTWTYNLKEAADADVLHKPQFLDLNTGLAMTGLAHLIMLGPWWLQGSCGPLMPHILGTWAATFAVGTWGVFGNKHIPV